MEIGKMEAKAIKKFIRSSPRKMRLVVDLIRGKNAAEAFSTLHFSTKLAAKDAERVLKSAISNLSNIEDGKSVKNEEVFVKTAYVDCGPIVKRIRPAPMGRAYRVRKRSNHLTIVVATKD
ncbi:MAG: 50S ribosomal protein L22 [Ignavibacteria bacterium GWB2_35_12]|nr:MAG: 50S ribosomal protein L22 [Ignavibacteria bacterium GWA2_35_8]OGU39766.1 MAG: 50S ribosomal protein L22 [Ignavibacteria bacterium GWB2_35_12]OGU95537.1 MAG: 50S ribosomal protein L22 [Ignavibacteria bacterium RIFOXYA2_FULL_35_10]OGV21343.1 MAG: 50S ribosomal protein L22 [Ignavibacteria bacterium RIFOXYC2_FULL_35_21]